MRAVLAILATLALAQCATPEDKRFQVGSDPEAMVMIGIAESAANTSPQYVMLWRKVDPVTGAFMPVGAHTTFEVRTNDNGSVRVHGIPGEFEYRRIEAGVYALDSIFAVIHDPNVNYFAQGLVTGPNRPSFEVGAGDAAYLGIWEMNLDTANAITHLWRLDEGDMHGAARAANATNGPFTVREAPDRSVDCVPRRLNNISQRQVC